MTEPMPVDELLERLKYSGTSAICTFEPPEVRRMHATVAALKAALDDERTNRERLHGQLLAAQQAFEQLDEKYSLVLRARELSRAREPVAHTGSPELVDEEAPR